MCYFALLDVSGTLIGGDSRFLLGNYSAISLMTRKQFDLKTLVPTILNKGNIVKSTISDWCVSITDVTPE